VGPFLKESSRGVIYGMGITETPRGTEPFDIQAHYIHYQIEIVDHQVTNGIYEPIRKPGFRVNSAFAEVPDGNATR